MQTPTPVVIDIQGLRRLGITWCNGYILQREKRGEFPHRHYLSRNKPVWILAEVEAWLAARIAHPP
jgi:predicted DNA-binding transcriptional regulator AlpA